MREMEKKTKIKAIIWDNAGVLGFTKGGSFVKLWAERLEVPFGDVIRVLTSPESKEFDLGNISKDDFFDYVIRDIGLPEEKKAALEVTIDDFYYDLYLFEYVKGLRGKYILALLSVMPSNVQELTRSYFPEFEATFDHVVVSCDVHMVKPNPKIFQLTLDKIGCRAEEAVFIDDTEENVIAAEKLGIRSILFKDREQALAGLEAILAEN